VVSRSAPEGRTAPKQRGAGARPYGKEQVVEAILDAAEAVVLERGLASTTTRDIATRADVNQALIFRHFGTKAALLTAMQRRHTQRFWARIASLDVPLDQLFVEFSADANFWKLLARSALDHGIEVPPPGQTIPGIELLLTRVGQAQAEGVLPRDVEAERILYLQFALVLGLVVLEPALSSVFSLPSGAQATRGEILRLWFRVAASSSSSTSG
jgi:AcrR family transcriptional regulator